MVDVATLTGEITVSLGEGLYAGLFANDDLLADQLIASGAATNERLWCMPMGDDYERMIDSTVADMKNVANNRWKGAESITAAQFLQRFANKVRWAHLDISGVAWNDDGNRITPKRATGFGVMLLNKFVRDHCESGC
ncbi:hypothetical protein [Anaplasma platys]|uniref:hypothetical protein n=1 Tax=Anaplasma platys TaxID=949 RepID=UPI00145F698A|nr:hypothetical protein [Anaplasma platys]